MPEEGKSHALVNSDVEPMFAKVTIISVEQKEIEQENVIKS